MVNSQMVEMVVVSVDMKKPNSKTLVIFAHPALEKSRANQLVYQRLSRAENITFCDLYQRYPDFLIDVEHEQAALLEHDLIVFAHPFYWYSCPPLLKHWIDVVLQFGFAYGPDGKALSGKTWLSAITTGGGRTTYSSDGHNRFSIEELMRPFEQTAALCEMSYLKPHVVFAVNKLNDVELSKDIDTFIQRLNFLIDNGPASADFTQLEFFSDWNLPESQI